MAHEIIHVHLTIAVDVAGWTREYGVDLPVAEDVERYIAHLVRDSAAARYGAILEVREVVR